MTNESDLLAIGDGVLLNHGGELLTYAGESLTALVDRNTGRILRRYPQFSEQTECVIWVRYDDLDDAPVAGEHFLDASGNYYRIIQVDFDGSGWSCACMMERT